MTIKEKKGKLKGLRSLRVGDYRALYVVDDGARVVEVLAVGPRENVYC